MPDFYPEDMDITPSEFVGACSKSEIKELIDVLIEDGHINKSQTDKQVKMSAVEQIFEDHLNSLHGKWNMLTQEEEETIMKIAKRFH